MTAGTAVVVSIAIVCGTILALAIIGGITNHLKSKQATQLSQSIAESIKKKLNKD